MQPLAAKTPVRGSVSNSRTANLTEIANANAAASSTVPKMGNPTLTGGVKQISLSWSHPQGVTDLQAYRVRYKKKGASTWTFADAKAETGNQNFEGHLTSAAIPAHENYTMEDDTTYQVQIRAGKWNGGYGGWGAWSDTVETKTLPKPSTLTASNITNGSATLAITDHTGNWYYKYTIPSGGTCSTDAVTGTSTSLTGLSSNTSYTFKAYSDNNCTTANELTTDTTDAHFLTTPDKATVLYLGERSREIKIWWQSPSGATTVRVQRKRSTQNWSEAFTTTASASIGQMRLVNGTNGVTYNIRLSFKSEQSGYGPWSDVLTGTPGPVTFTASNVSQSGATLTLDKYDGWNTYAATDWSYRYTSPTGGQCTNVPKEDGRTVTVNDLNSGTSYTYKAYKNSGCSDELATASAFTTLTPTLTATSVTHNRATLTIANHSGNWHYKYTSPTGGTCSSTAVTTSSVDLASLNTGTSYTYKAYSNSDCSTELTTDATDAEFVTKPGEVTGVTVTPGNTSLAVSWTALSGTVTVYKVQWKSDDEGWDANNRQATSNTTSKTLSNLTNGTEYSIRVAGTNDSGTGPWSSPPIGSAPSTTPPAPNKPTVKARHEAVILEWTGNGDGGSSITGWKYLKKEGANNWEPTATAIPSSGASTTSYTITGLTNGREYKFKVLAVNVNGDGSPSPESDPARPGSVTLNAESITGTGATLRINGHTGAWSYKGQQNGATCNGSGSPSGTTANLSSLREEHHVYLRRLRHGGLQRRRPGNEDLHHRDRTVQAHQRHGCPRQCFGHTGLDIGRQRRFGHHPLGVPQEGGQHVGRPQRRRQLASNLRDLNQPQLPLHHQPHGHRSEQRHEIPIQGACQERQRQGCGIR